MFCLLLTAALTGAAPETERPNVVVIMTDDQGYGDVSLHGNPHLRTPHLDAFATAGIQMRRFYCSPVCAPTRASLLTGRDAYRTGVIHTSRGGAKMHGDEITLTELLRDAGYMTGIFGKWHLGDNAPMRPQDQGFAETLIHRSGGIGQTPDLPNSYQHPWLWHNGRRVQKQGYCTDVFTDAALAFIERHHDRPFFVYLPTNTPHTPLEIAEQWVAPYRERGLDETTARIYGMVENIDLNVGRVLRKLDELSLRHNTIVLFLSDNGPQQPRYTAGLRGRKASVYEGGIRVPCFVQWPAKFEGGRRLDTIAAHIDLLPTLADACGVALPSEHPVDGISLLPLWAGTSHAEPNDRMLFLQCHRGLQPQPFHNAAVISQTRKLVLNPGTFGDEWLPDEREAQIELYDIAHDPGEEHDLAPQEPQRVEHMRAQYVKWFNQVRTSRNFQPGVIEIGSAAEPVSHLCRYQDGTFAEGTSRGWSVRVVAGGAFNCRVITEDRSPGVVHVDWLGNQTAYPVGHQDSIQIRLPAGEGTLDIWRQKEGQLRQRPADNSVEGDVILWRS